MYGVITMVRIDKTRKRSKINVKANSIIETIIKINMDNMITFNTPILVISFAAPYIFKAFFKLPVFANLASAIAWKNEKIKNIIKAMEIVRDKDINKENDALYIGSAAIEGFFIRS